MVRNRNISADLNVSSDSKFLDHMEVEFAQKLSNLWSDSSDLLAFKLNEVDDLKVQVVARKICKKILEDDVDSGNAYERRDVVIFLVEVSPHEPMVKTALL